PHALIHFRLFLASPGQVHSAGQGSVGVCRVTHDIDVFEAGAAIQPDVAQILSEKPETFAEKKDSDEPENNNGDERVTPEKGLNKIVGTPAANSQRRDDRRRRDKFSHLLIMTPWQRRRQIPKCYVYVTKFVRRQRTGRHSARGTNDRFNAKNALPSL